MSFGYRGREKQCSKRPLDKRANAQQRFQKMARNVLNSRLSIARNFILAEKSRLRSSPLLEAAKS